MIPVAGAYLHIRETFPPDEYTAIGEKIYEYMHSLESSFLSEAEKGIEITMQEGSTKVWAVVLTLTNALINYGSIRQSVDYIMKDTEIISRKIDSYLQDAWSVRNANIISHRRQTGVPGQIKALFDKVDRKELTPEDATAKAIAVIEKYASREENPSLKSISAKLLGEFKESAKFALPARTNIAASIDREERVTMEIVSQRRCPEPRLPAPPPQRLTHDLSRPKRLVIRKMPKDTSPVFEFF